MVVMLHRQRFLTGLTFAGIAAFGACSHEQKASIASPSTPVAVTMPPPAASRPVVAEAPPSRPIAAEKREPAIFFDFDSAVLGQDARPILEKVWRNLRATPDEKLRIEGNCDELGTAEYNLALGEHRARAAKEYLVHMGVPRRQIATISYGSQRPRFPGGDESAHAKNRRDDLIVTR